MQIARNGGEIEAVARRQRQHDRVLGGRRLQLEVELEAEALAQREAPGAIDPAAERRVDDELHPAALVEEALEHDGRLRRHGAERGLGGAEVLDELASRRRAPTPRVCKRLGRRRRSSRNRDTACESSSVRPGASPSQNGIVGAWPCASSTRTRPASTRRILYDVLPSWNTSPARLSTAKSSLTVPTFWPAGSSTTS